MAHACAVRHVQRMQTRLELTESISALNYSRTLNKLWQPMNSIPSMAGPDRGQMHLNKLSQPLCRTASAMFTSLSSLLKITCCFSPDVLPNRRDRIPLVRSFFQNFSPKPGGLIWVQPAKSTEMCCDPQTKYTHRHTRLFWFVPFC